MNNFHQIDETVAHLFRHESGKMCAVLAKLFGLDQIEIAEDIVQETLISALETWKLSGIPDNPSAWLYRVAKNKTIDFLRRERNFTEFIAPNVSIELMREHDNKLWLDELFVEHEIQDAQLRMMFVCCHPDLVAKQQLPLVLKTLCGLNVEEIATAFLQTEETISKRIFRAREKIRNAKLSLEVPYGEALIPRIDSVLNAIYLLYNEGYKSSTDNAIIRKDLCGEAMRLCVLLAQSDAGNLSKTHALLSLICFQSARFDARVDSDGKIILLENQDRSLWNRSLINLGYVHLKEASKGKDISEYHLEAAISSYHSSAKSFKETNFKAIIYCYDLLLQIKPSSIILFNRAIALADAKGPKEAIETLHNIKDMDDNYLYHTAFGDFYAKTNQQLASKASYEKALSLVHLPSERQVIEEKMKSVG